MTGFKLNIYFEGGKSALIEVGTYNFIAMPRFTCVAPKGKRYDYRLARKLQGRKVQALA